MCSRINLFRRAVGSIHDISAVDQDSKDAIHGDDRATRYRILSASDVRERQEEVIRLLATLLTISTAESCTLLHRYKWNAGKVLDEWLADERNARSAAGLPQGPVGTPPTESPATCPICFEACPRDEMSSASCGHGYCRECWRGYIGSSINDGPGCLALQCPNASCTVAVDRGMIGDLASDGDKERYSWHLLRSYVEGNRRMKWCPNPGCELVGQFDSGAYDIRCGCSHSFCWNCEGEAHRPADCGTAAKWASKNPSDSETCIWILAYAKPCPNCERPITKEGGCLRMECPAPCGFKFCWRCLGPWSLHSDFFRCDHYVQPQELEGMGAKISFKRYNLYFDGWDRNRRSRQKSLVELQLLKDWKLDLVGMKLSVPVSELEFITEAWLQIVECRRALQWTYVYGYYEYKYKDEYKYEYAKAESLVERLHHCAEEGLGAYLDPKTPIEGFMNFKEKLARLTRECRTYFDNLVRSIETGLHAVRVRLDGDGGGGDSSCSCFFSHLRESVFLFGQSQK